MGEKNKYGYEHDDGHYSKMTGNDSNSSYSIYDKNPSEEGHSAIHININTDTDQGSIVEHDSSGNTTKTDISCYLTSACMRYMNESFNDNCYELNVLRWFRDNFVSKEDIKHYYAVAPIIVEAINQEINNNLIYDYIYDNIILYCVEQIEMGNYEKAYQRYKSSILSFKEHLARPFLEQKIIKILKRG